MTQENHLPPLGLRSLPKKQIYITFAGVMLAMFLGSLDQTVVGTAMPRIIADLGGFSQYTWITTAYVITSAVAIPITGKLTDIYGRKYFYIGGLVIFVLASVACGLSTTMNEIIIFRGVQGIGAGVMIANAFTVIGDLFPPGVRGRYQGYISGVYGLSSVIGPSLGGYITDSLSWHWVFFVNIPLGLIVIVLFIFFFPNIRADNLKHSIDWIGVILLIIGVVPIMLGLSWGGVEYAWGSTEILSMFVVGAVALVLFIFVESRVKEPMIPLFIFKDRIVSISAIMTFLAGVAMFSSITFVPLYFQGVRGATATASGNCIMPMMVGNFFGSFLSGQLLARAGGHYRIQGMIGLVLMAVGMWLMTQLNIDTSDGVMIIEMIIFGFGLGILMPLYTLAVQNAVPYKVLGTATSAMTFFRSLGGSVGLAAFGAVMNNSFATSLLTKLPPEFLNAAPSQQLNNLMSNPQALVSADAHAQLQGIVAKIGDQSGTLLDRVMQALREALSSSITRVFLYTFIAVIVAFAINLFLKELPLRKHYLPGEDETAGKSE